MRPRRAGRWQSPRSPFCVDCPILSVSHFRPAVPSLQPPAAKGICSSTASGSSGQSLPESSAGSATSKRPLRAHSATARISSESLPSRTVPWYWWSKAAPQAKGSQSGPSMSEVISSSATLTSKVADPCPLCPKTACTIAEVFLPAGGACVPPLLNPKSPEGSGEATCVNSVPSATPWSTKVRSSCRTSAPFSSIKCATPACRLADSCSLSFLTVSLSEKGIATCSPAGLHMKTVPLAMFRSVKHEFTRV